MRGFCVTCLSAVEGDESVDNVVKGKGRMLVYIGYNGVVEVFIPVLRNVLKAYASADDTADGRARATQLPMHFV